MGLLILINGLEVIREIVVLKKFECFLVSKVTFVNFLSSNLYSKEIEYEFLFRCVISHVFG